MDLISLSEENFYNMLSHMSNEKYGVETYRYRVDITNGSSCAGNFCTRLYGSLP